MIKAGEFQAVITISERSGIIWIVAHAIFRHKM